MENFGEIKRAVLKLLLNEKAKEYYCHVQFVTQIGLILAAKYKVDPRIIELSCLLHDIGRDHEIGEETHETTGARMVPQILKPYKLPKATLDLIVSCVRNHNSSEPLTKIEEKIVLTADCASKVLYHEAFMLMCKKPTYEERAAWGLKYLEKGYHKVQLEDYKTELTPTYERLKQIYYQVTQPEMSVHVR